jgi:uncharacterized protein DUF397
VLSSITDASTLDGTVNWRKPSRSGGNNNCFECGELPDGSMAVRDSKDPSGSALVFDRSAWVAFTAAIKDKDGEFANL